MGAIQAAAPPMVPQEEVRHQVAEDFPEVVAAREAEALQEAGECPTTLLSQ